MKEFNTYIFEKLKINKDSKLKYQEELKNIIDEYLSEVTVDEYNIYFNISRIEVYIEIEFKLDQDNSQLHSWGYDIFNLLFNKEKFKPYNQGTDWWISSQRKIVFNFDYK